MNLMKTADLNIDLNNNPKSNINYTNKIINKYTNIINIHYPYVESTFFIDSIIQTVILRLKLD